MLTTGAALAVDGRGNVMVPEEVSLRIVAAKTATFYGQKMTKGHIYTIARERQFREMLTVANDPADIVIFGKGALVKVLAARSGRFYGHKMTANDSYTVAGGGRRVLGDGGPATAVALASVRGLVPTHAGILIAEGPCRVRRVSR